MNEAPYGSGLNPGKYVGGVEVDQHDVPQYADFDKAAWALEFIGRYGGISGSHHKDWVLDQVARILHGARVVITKASWESGRVEYRIHTEEPASQYHRWVKKLLGEEVDGEYEYDYSEGIAP